MKINLLALLNQNQINCERLLFCLPSIICFRDQDTRFQVTYRMNGFCKRISFHMQHTKRKLASRSSRKITMSKLSAPNLVVI